MNNHEEIGCSARQVVTLGPVADMAPASARELPTINPSDSHRLARRRRPDSRQPVWSGVSAAFAYDGPTKATLKRFVAYDLAQGSSFSRRGR
jgi:hypothetical protein